MTSLASAAPAGLSPEQLEQRRHGVGASEIAAVLGLDPYRTALDVWGEKTGRGPVFLGNEYTKWGLRLEPVLLAAYAEETGARLLPSPGTVSHPTELWMLCTPDALALPEGDRPVGLEAKNRNARMASLWGEAGSDRVPDPVALQCQWSMGVTGIARWDVVVLLGGHDFRVYRLVSDPALLAEMVALARAFWERHVLADVPPTVVAADNEGLGRILRQRTEILKPAGPEVQAALLQLREARARQDAARQERELLEALIKTAIGEDAGLACPVAKATWKTARESRSVDYRRLVDEHFMLEMEDAERRELLERFVAVKPGSRRFLVTFAGEEE